MWKKLSKRMATALGTRAAGSGRKFRPCLEALETRLTPAVTASLSPDGVLSLTGDDGANAVVARDRGDGKVEVIAGNINADWFPGFNVTEFSEVSSSTFEGVAKVRADMGAGNDLFFYYYSGEVMDTDLDLTLGRGTDYTEVRAFIDDASQPIPKASGLDIDIRTGDKDNQEDTDTRFNGIAVLIPQVAGDLRINLTGTDLQGQLEPVFTGGVESFVVSLFTVDAGAEASVRIDGRDGIDHMGVLVFFAVNGDLNVTLSGGGGDDFVQGFVGAFPVMNGTVDLELDGGDGNDVVLGEVFGTLNGTVDLELDGGDGNDFVIGQIVDLFFAQTTVNGTVSVQANGGDGDDAVLGFVQTTGGTTPQGSSSLVLRGGDGADLIASIQDDPTGQVQVGLHGGDGDDTAALVLLSGPLPTANGFESVLSFASIEDLFAAFPDEFGFRSPLF